MSQDHTLKKVLHAWAEVFMHQSFSNFKHFMDEWDLSHSQVSTLFLLNHCNSCGITDIGEHLGVTNAAASQLVERLVKQDLITRTEDQKDRRFKLIQLTPQGRAVIHEGLQARLRWLERVANDFSPEEKDTIINAMRLLTEAASDLGSEVSTPANKIASTNNQ